MTNVVVEDLLFSRCGNRALVKQSYGCIVSFQQCSRTKLEPSIVSVDYQDQIVLDAIVIRD